ncbi:MAG: heme-binding domain-containing protein [Sulfurimonas sp.]|uniref:heme-binding domain-containing protein n=1 Tax=Sulfurimonas sp. TaxID=2022749 RepID=UPI002624803B|nr:heme-binding domain-containing protein [Sulfurimonas sp.]MDD3476660.1 heme-binding domain-containing protein [Sulfurimonas sp.]
MALLRNKFIISFVALLILLQFIQVEKTNPPIDEQNTLVTDEPVMSILKKSCYDCHSNETLWPSYASVAPISFFVASHVKDARKALNFSQYNIIEPSIKEARLKRAIITVKNEYMALPSYRYAHEGANLTKEEKEILMTWFEEELKTLKKNSLKPETAIK